MSSYASSPPATGAPANAAATTRGALTEGKSQPVFVRRNHYSKRASAHSAARSEPSAQAIVTVWSLSSRTSVLDSTDIVTGLGSTFGANVNSAPETPIANAHSPPIAINFFMSLSAFFLTCHQLTNYRFISFRNLM